MMGMRVTFELDDDDLRHFRLIMRESRQATSRSTPEEIVDGARRLLQQVGDTKVPQFIRDRLDKLEIMIHMLLDHEWRLPAKDSARVLNALAYFTEPEDLIPDHIPGLGFLDDAIMIELVARELQHEIEAYQDFCEFRRGDGKKRGVKTRSTDISRENWLEDRREELQTRMRRRRKSRGKRPRKLL